MKTDKPRQKKKFFPSLEQLKETKMVINAQNSFENQKTGLDKSLEEK
jgi:hypothetical protein